MELGRHYGKLRPFSHCDLGFEFIYVPLASFICCIFVIANFQFNLTLLIMSDYELWLHRNFMNHHLEEMYCLWYIMKQIIRQLHKRITLTDAGNITVGLMICLQSRNRKVANVVCFIKVPWKWNMHSLSEYFKLFH